MLLKNGTCRLIYVFLALVCLVIRAEASESSSPLGRKIANFVLNDVRGKRFFLKDLRDNKAVVVIFFGTECPISNSYLATFLALYKKYNVRGVSFVGINSNFQENPEHIAAHARQYNIPFPVLRDPRGEIADRFGAQRNPEAFVLDAERIIRYSGRIDDQYGVGFARPVARENDLALAVDQVLEGKPVTKPASPASGCLIARSVRPVKHATVTYSDVRPILQKNCQECHRPGDIGPMSLVTYNDAARWSRTIKEAVCENRMPPWFADPRFGKFANERRLSEQEREILLNWIKQGCPKGSERGIPTKVEPTDGWRIGKPDLILTMKEENTVPAAAPHGLPYRYCAIPTNFSEDRWIRAAEVRPGNRSVVHHVHAYMTNDVAAWRIPAQVGENTLAIYASRDSAVIYGPNQAKKIPKGSSLILQLHYTVNGIEQKDRSSVGLIFAKHPPKFVVQTEGIEQRRLMIPPGVNNYKAVAATTFKNDVVLLDFLPHMHLRGKSFEYRAFTPDGKEKILLSVPKFNFKWQQCYHLAEPLHLPAGTRIRCTAYYDNSAKNPNNPDPTRYVHWGPQTWDEMMIGYVEYALDVPKLKRSR